MITKNEYKTNIRKFILPDFMVLYFINEKFAIAAVLETIPKITYDSKKSFNPVLGPSVHRLIPNTKAIINQKKKLILIESTRYLKK